MLPPCARDVMVWATITGDDALATELWSYCTDPIHAALLCAHVAAKLTRQVSSWGRPEVAARAREMQARAMGVINAVPNVEVAFRILSVHRPHWFGSLLDLALHLGMKEFIAHRHCTALAQRSWRGHYAGSTVRLPERFARPSLYSRLELPVWAFLPLLNRWCVTLPIS